jgi:hypothetical protein
MKSLNSSEVAALIPQYWDLTASTVEDIIFFGQITIREMIRSWRYTADRLASQIKGVDEKLEFLQGKDAADIREVAKQYENPDFPQIGVRAYSTGVDPEPLDDASINRKCGATTFNFCGWCKYASGGNSRYSYIITPSCGIKNASGLRDEEYRFFDTPCFLKEALGKVFDEIRKGLARERKRLIEKKRVTDEKIKFLLVLKKRAEKKPAMPYYRPHNWFNVDDSVVCYDKWKKRIARNNFATAKVIKVYHRRPGPVSVCYDQCVHSGDYIETPGDDYDMSSPEVMHTWEFEYLLRHSDFASLWMKKGTSTDLRGSDAERFLRSFAHEARSIRRRQKSKSSRPSSTL